MNKIIIENLDQVEFAKELKEKVKKELENSQNNILEFEITNALGKNFEILGYYMIQKKIEKVYLNLRNDLDIIVKKKLFYHFKKFFIYYSKNFIIEFKDLIDDEIILILGMKNYLHYKIKLNQKPMWNENFMKREKREIEKHKKLKNYETFNDCLELFEKFPFSKFNFPTEKEKTRFVFYFYMYSEEQKKILFDFLEKHNLTKLKEYNLLKNLIQNNKINEEIYYYAFGFSYQNDELIRFTLYTKFDVNLLENNQLNDFIFKKHNFKLDFKFQNIWYYGVDFFFEKECEFKFYDEPYFFNEKISKNEINQILKNKKCVKVSKFDSFGKLLTNKYEFEIQKEFDKNEQEILSKFNLYNSKNQILAIYLKEGKIIHKVFYNL